MKSQAAGKAEQRFRIKGDRTKNTVLTEGRAIGQKVGTGPVRLVRSTAEMERVQPGDILVTDMTDPNWEPVMKRAAHLIFGVLWFQWCVLSVSRDPAGTVFSSPTTNRNSYV